MQHLKLPALLVAILSTTGLAARAQAQAQAAPPEPYAAPVVDSTGAPVQENPIPPNAEGGAIPSQGGGYCFGGPHPAPGGGWEASPSPHTHEYAPFDLRLFVFHEGCYYFVGDPRDFGYTGQTYSYYGAHPIASSYGGGWCFMIGGHSHWWRPWSPYFTTVGPWFYWNGPYDPFFWSYWPYYSFYYRSYYPSYYAGGRYYQTWRSAPAISRVPPTGWRGSPGGVGAGGGWRGAPAGGARVGGAYGAPGGGWRGAPPSAGGGWHSGPPASGGWHGSPVPNSSPLRAAPPSGGGWHGAPGGYSPAPSGGGWHGSPGGFSPAPSGGGWHGSPGGGFHGGGSGGGFRGGGGGGWRGGGRH